MNRSVREILNEFKQKKCRHGVHTAGKPRPYPLIAGHANKRLGRSPALPHNKNFGH